MLTSLAAERIHMLPLRPRIRNLPKRLPNHHTLCPQQAKNKNVRLVGAPALVHGYKLPVDADRKEYLLPIQIKSDPQSLP